MLSASSENVKIQTLQVVSDSDADSPRSPTIISLPLDTNNSFTPILFGFFMICFLAQFVHFCVIVPIYDEGNYPSGLLIWLTNWQGYVNLAYYLTVLVDFLLFYKKSTKHLQFHEFRERFFASLYFSGTLFVFLAYITLVRTFGRSSLTILQQTYAHVIVMIWVCIEMRLVKHRYLNPWKLSLTSIIYAMCYLIWNVSLIATSDSGKYPYAFQRGLTPGEAVGVYAALILFIWLCYWFGYFINGLLHEKGKFTCCQKQN